MPIWDALTPAAAVEPELVADNTVSEAELAAEREATAAIERQLADERAARQAAEQRTNLMLQRFAAPAPAAPEIPAIDADPVGHIVATQRQLSERQQQIETAERQRAERAQLTAAVSGLQQRAVAAENSFRAANPDYDAAVEHLRSAQHAELEALGIADRNARELHINRQALQVAHTALQSGRDPAATIFALAKARGFRGGDGSGGAPAAPGSTRQASPRGGLTADALLKMNNADFAKAIATAEGRALLGG